MSNTMLTVEGLAVEYGSRRFRGRPNRVIHDVSFSLAEGETLALVGESGSGKTTIGRAILGLTRIAEGTVRLGERDITHLSRTQRRPLASDIQAIFQNPYGSLNPALTIGQILAEPLIAAGARDRAATRRRIGEILERVRMPADTVRRYPGNFSGGQRQRIAIARALALNPRVIVCDEPTSALDVSTQATVLDLLRELQGDSGLAYLFITHDLAVVREFADRTVVLEKGAIVEEGPSSRVCDAPQHEYTKRLVAAAPVPDPVLQKERREARLAALVEVVV